MTFTFFHPSDWKRAGRKGKGEPEGDVPKTERNVTGRIRWGPWRRTGRGSKRGKGHSAEVKESSRADPVSGGSDGGSQAQQEMWWTSSCSLFTPSKGECQGQQKPLWDQVFLVFSWSFLCFSLCPLPLVLSLGTTGKSLAPSSWPPPCRYLEAFLRSPRSLLFSRLNKPSYLSLSS